MTTRLRPEDFDRYIATLSEGLRDDIHKDEIRSIINKLEQMKSINRKVYRRVIDRPNIVNSQKLSEIIHRKSSGDVIIYIQDSNQYTLFDDSETYQNYIKEINDEEDVEDGKEVVTYQIVLNDEKQKLIIGCKTEGNIDEAKKKVEQYFKKETKVVYNPQHKCYQIVVDIILEKYKDMNDYFDNLTHFITSSNEPKLADDIHRITPKLENVTNQRYLMFALGDSNPANLATNLEKKNVTIQYYNNCQFNNVGVNNGNITNYNKPVEDGTRAWVTNNPPSDDTTSSDYYKQYQKYMKDDNKKAMHVQKFASILKDMGYTKKRSGTKTMWVPKD